MSADAGDPSRSAVPSPDAGDPSRSAVPSRDARPSGTSTAKEPGEREEAAVELPETAITVPETGDPRVTAADDPPERRPLIERIGLALIASLLTILFGGVAAASWVGGELFLTVMAGIGCLMTAWVGAMTLFRG